eukprot:36218_1
MSLKQAVRFRNLVTKLTKQETNTFLLKLANNQPELLVAALGNHFKSPLTDESLVKGVNNNISEIITIRESSNANDNDSSPSILNLHTITEVLISHISSFLYQYEYANLCKVNRSIFIGCHSPNNLQEINFRTEWQKNYFPFNYKLYTSIKSLSFDLSLCKNRLHEVNHSVFLNQLQSVNWNVSNTVFNRCIIFDLHKIPTCHNIKTLKLDNLKKNIIINNKFFDQFLLKFPNVKYLCLDSVADVTFDIFTELYPNLKGLGVIQGLDNDAGKYVQLLKHYADQIECLNFQISSNVRIMTHQLKEIKFGKLEELKLSDNLDIIGNVAETAKHLRQIDLSHVHLNYMFNEAEDLNVIFMKMITQCPLLHVIQIFENYPWYLGDMLDGINDGLSKSKNQQRDSFQICLHMRDDTVDVLGLVQNISAIVTTINSSNIDDYMLVWEFGGGLDGTKLTEQICADFRSNGVTAVLKEDRWPTTILIENDGCKIDGYSATWRMMDAKLMDTVRHG